MSAGTLTVQSSKNGGGSLIRWTASLLSDRMRAVVMFAIRDARHDLRTTMLSTLFLFALIAPIAALHALQSGIVSAWAESLSQDVRNSEVRIRGEISMDEGRLARIAAWPETGFLVPSPSAIVMTQSVRAPAAGENARPGLPTPADLRTTAAGDPALFGLSAPAIGQAVVSRLAADQIAPNLKAGDRIELIVRRQPDGLPRQTAFVDLEITGILEKDRWAGANVFLHPDLARAVRDWNGFRQRGESPDPTALDSSASWESMRIHAATVRQAPALAERLREEGFDVRLNSDQIAQFVRLEDGLQAVFSAIVGFGALALAVSIYMLQSLRVAQKRREIALIASIGLGRRQLVWFPVVGAVLHAAVALLLVCVCIPVVRPALRGFAIERAGLDTFALPPMQDWALAALAVIVLCGIAARLAATPINHFAFGPLLRED